MFHWTNDGLEMFLRFFLDEKRSLSRIHRLFFGAKLRNALCVYVTHAVGQPRRATTEEVDKGNLRPFRLKCERMNDTCRQYKKVGNNTCEYGTVCVE